MAGGMPYWLEKGPALSILEDFLDDRDRLKGYLRKLLMGKKIVDAGGYDSAQFTNAAAQKYYPYGGVTGHVEHHWFAPGSTFWNGYEGEKVAEIVRQAMIRAAAVSLGLGHIDLTAGGKLTAADADKYIKKANRHWPISLFWKCGQSWFETWVTWSGHVGSSGEGSVTVLFATPPDVYTGSALAGHGGVEDHPVPAMTSAKPTAARDMWLLKGRADGFGVDVPGPAPIGPAADLIGQAKPPDLESDKGMIVITHESNALAAYKAGDTFVPGKGVDPPPKARFVGTGRVVVVSPSETWGGVASQANRRRYTG